jgi:hypothetical protein
MEIVHKRKSQYVRFEGFHGFGFEEFRLLGYRNPVSTSQETYYVSATEATEVFHGGDCKECRLLGCDAMWLL